MRRALSQSLLTNRAGLWLIWLSVLWLTTVLIFRTGARLNAASAAQSQSVKNVSTVSAASYNKVVAAESIVTTFGEGLVANTTFGADADLSAPGIQLPTLLGGLSLEVNGRSAGLFYVSPKQINFHTPPDLEPGTGYVIVKSDRGAVIGSGEIEIRPNAPALFTANATGEGVPAGVLLRVKADGAQSYEPIVRFEVGEFVPLPLDLGPPGERVFLILFLTGARRVAKASDTRVLIGGAEVVPTFIGPVPEFVGVEQLNFELPRTLQGRLSFVLSAIGYPASNICQIELAPPNNLPDPNLAPPTISSPTFTRPVLAGETIEINGTGFSAHPSEKPEVLIADSQSKLFNAQVEEVTPTRLKLIVPFGAGSGKLIVRTPRGESSASIELRTSISGIVQAAQLQQDGSYKRVGVPNVTVRVPGLQPPVRTSADGSFVVPDVPQSEGLVFEVDGTTVGATPPYDKDTRKMPTRAGRDNQYPEYIELKQASGRAIQLGGASAPPDGMLSVPASATPAENAFTGQTGDVVFDPNGSTAQLPDGTRVDRLTVTVLDPGRTPADLTPANAPPEQFSSTIVQLTPFGARLMPGGKLTFPNTDGLPAGSAATLFRFDQKPDSATLGKFIAEGTATVSTDGMRIETARDAIKEATYYFVSVPRTTTTIYGSVVEEDDTPARGALVQVRGKSVFALTDDNGAFILTNVPILSNEQLTLEVSYLRPDGTVDRTERAGIRPGTSALTFVSPPIVLAGRGRARAPIILAPRFLTVEAGKTTDFTFIAYARDRQTRLRNVTLDGVSFASIAQQGNDSYRLRLTPGADLSGTFRLTITATITARPIQNSSTSEVIIVEVKAANSNQPIANSQSLIVDEDKPLSLTLQGSGGAVYRIVSLPRRGSLSGTAPNLVYMPEANYNGADSFSFTVSNGTATSSAAIVSLAIRPDDDRPRLDVGTIYTANIGTLLNVVINGFDVDAGQQLTLKDSGLPVGATITQTTATSWLLSWTPKFDQLGSYTVNLMLTDGTSVMPDNKAVTIVVDAKWASASPLDDSTSIYSLASIGNALFAGTVNGVYRTTDNGISWTPVNNGMGRHIVRALTVKNNVLFAGTFLYGVYRSTDKGASWVPANNGLANKDVNAFVANDSALFAGTDRGIYRTTDNGVSWTSVGNGLVDNPVSALAIKENTLFAGTEGGGVFRLAVNAVNWAPINNGLGNTDIRALAIMGNALFVGTYGSGVYRSTDNGASWTSINNGLVGKYVYALTVKDNALLAGTERSVYRSTDDGASWALISNGLGSVTALAVKEGVLFAGTPSNSVYRSTDNGANWTLAKTGLGNESISALAVKGDWLFAGIDCGGVYRSRDNGTSWGRADNENGLLNTCVNALAVKENFLFAGTDTGVYRSADNGANWRQVGTSSLNKNVGMLVVKENALFAGTNAGIYRSMDDGASWAPVNNGLGEQTVRELTVKDNVLFALIYPTVYRTTDNGESWAIANNGLNNRNVYALTVKDQTLFAIVYGGGVYRSTDNGVSWTFVSNGLESTLVSRGPGTVAYFGANTLIVKNNALFVGTFFGVSRSMDDGVTWTPVNNGLGRRDVSSLIVKGGTLFAGTQWDGIFLLAESAAAWSESNNGLANPIINAATMTGDSFLVGTETGVFRSANKGQSWFPASNGLSPIADVRAFASTGNGVLAGLAGEGVYFSNDQGRNWSAYNAGLTNQQVNALAGDGRTIYAGTQGGVFRSFDGGVNWVTANNGLTRLQVLSLTVSGGAVYAGTEDGLFRSTNQGGAWSEASTGLTDRYIVTLGVAPDGLTLLAGTSSGLFRSMNQGQSWTPVTQGLPERVVVLTFAQQGRRLLAGTVYGFFISEDNGLSWQQLNSGLLTLQVGALAVSGETVLAGTRSGGVFISQLAGANCLYSITPTSQSFSLSGGASSINVTTQSNCDWTATSNAPWVTITSGTGGKGNGTVNFTVAANPGTVRTTTITVAGQTFTVTQAGASCDYSIAPTSQSFELLGGSGIVNVTAPIGCAWAATSNFNFITITSGSSGNGNGTVFYSINPNISTSQRTGTLTIAGQAFTVTQAGSPTARTVDLLIDDGTYESRLGTTGGGNAYFLTRLTPTAYPATLRSVMIYFLNRTNGVPTGTPLTIMFGSHPTGSGNIDGVVFQELAAQVQALDQFNVYNVPEITITSGDFVVGFRITHGKDIFPCVIDLTPPSQHRSYYSASGLSFKLLDDYNPPISANLGIRARVSIF
jgi:uncharacterized protein (TIGR03437 family)